MTNFLRQENNIFKINYPKMKSLIAFCILIVGFTFACVKTEQKELAVSSNNTVACFENEKSLLENPIFNTEYKIGVDEFSELDDKPILPIAFIEYKEIKNTIIELQSNMSNTETAEKKTILFNLYGYIGIMEVPEDMDNTSIALESINDEALGTYNSTHDFKSNSLESKYEVKCFNTDGYTMTGVVKNRNGNRRLLSIEEGKIKVKEI